MRGAKYNPNYKPTPFSKAIGSAASAVGGAIKNTVKGAGDELNYLGGKVKDFMNRPANPGMTRLGRGARGIGQTVKNVGVKGMEMPSPSAKGKILKKLCE